MAHPDPAEPEAPLARHPQRELPGAASGPRGLLALGLILRPAPWRWAAAVLWGVLATGLALALTAVSAWLIVRASGMPSIMYLNVAIVGVRFFGIARAAMRYTERLWTHRAIFEATDSLRLRLWRSIAARGAGSRRLLEGGTALDYLVTTLDELRDLAPRVVTPAAVGVLTIVGVTVTSALIDPSVALFVLIGLGGTALVAALLAHAVGRSASLGTVASRALLQRRFSALSVSGVQLRANGLGAAAVASVGEADAALAAHDRRTGTADGLAAALVVLGTALVAVAVPLFHLNGFVGAGASAENVTVVSLLALACSEPLLGLVTAVQRAPSLFAALRTLQPLLRAPSAVHRPGGTVPEAPIRQLELERLAARWPGTSEEVFEQVSGRAAHGQWLVVEGPSGSGKSTMLSVLMGALPPSAGAVVADDDEVALGADGWRSLVAWCPQEAHVFDSSIRANLLIGRGRDDAVDDTEMLDVLGRVGLGKLVAQLPQGLDSRVGRGGSSLSGGERQRLAVARTLLARSELVLLDEPTAHLDEATAAAMTADLRTATAGRIVVLVSHRAADLRPDDVIVQLAPAARVA